MVWVRFLCDQRVPTPDRALTRTHFSQAKVENLGVATLRHKDVRRLDVAVNYAFRMCCIQSVCNINRNVQKLFQFHRTASNHMPQCLAVQEFHGDKRLRSMLSNFVNRADIRMVQCRSCSCFTPKAFQSLPLVGKMFRKELQRNKPAQVSVFGLENHTHSATAEFLENAVMRDGLADERLGLRHLSSILGRALRQVNEPWPNHGLMSPQNENVRF